MVRLYVVVIPTVTRLLVHTSTADKPAVGSVVLDGLLLQVCVEN
jgi:hypothetical protein